MLIDRFGRRITYLRVSITDRCNLRCAYCMPEKGVTMKKRSAILSYEEIYEFVKVAVDLGISKIRITGGEPLVRRDVCRLIEMLAGIPGVNDLALTTNGILLGKYAAKLKSAGLKRVNISLDSLQPDRYNAITRGGNIQSVLQGIASARQAGLTPIKINCVLLEGINEDETNDFGRFGREHQAEIQFIQRMRIDKEKPGIPAGAVLIKRPPDCRICNRLRLTADGFIKPCLLSDDEINIRRYDYAEALKKAVAGKPESGTKCLGRSMAAIGG